MSFEETLKHEGNILMFDFSIPVAEYRNLINNDSNLINAYNIKFEFLRTQKGLDMIQTTFINISTSQETTILFRCNRQKTLITGDCFNLRTRKSIEGDITDTILYTYKTICAESSGSMIGYSAYSNNELCKIIYIDEGIERNFFNAVIGENKIYSLEGFNGPKVNITINQFLADNPEIAKKIKNNGCKSQIDILNSLALTLLAMKTNEEIDFDTFIDLFNQCCILGADNKNVINFYKILKQ